MTRYSQVVPAIIPESREALLAYAKQLSFSRELQLDLVDGKFVTSVSWPYEPQGDPMSVKSVLDAYTLEVDLMVAEPLPAAREWIKAGADMLVFHIETVALEAFAAFAEATPVSLGVSAHGDTPLSKLIEYAKYADYIQLMGIYEIGAQGLPFDEAVLDKVRELKQVFPDMMISVDGSVNKTTIARLQAAGVDRFICGSAIVRQDDPKQAHQDLEALING
jgi:ribulose-phosphate 3-epimerase